MLRSRMPQICSINTHILSHSLSLLHSCPTQDPVNRTLALFQCACFPLCLSACVCVSNVWCQSSCVCVVRFVRCVHCALLKLCVVPCVRCALCALCVVRVCLLCAERCALRVVVCTVLLCVVHCVAQLLPDWDPYGLLSFLNTAMLWCTQPPRFR